MNCPSCNRPTVAHTGAQKIECTRKFNGFDNYDIDRAKLKQDYIVKYVNGKMKTIDCRVPEGQTTL